MLPVDATKRAGWVSLTCSGASGRAAVVLRIEERCDWGGQNFVRLIVIQQHRGARTHYADRAVRRIGIKIRGIAAAADYREVRKRLTDHRRVIDAVECHVTPCFQQKLRVCEREQRSRPRGAG